MAEIRAKLNHYLLAILAVSEFFKLTMHLAVGRYPQSSTGLFRQISVYMLVGMALAVSGCVTIGKQFVPVGVVEGQATLYIYREDGIVGRGIDLEISANGEPLTTLEVGTYHAIHLPAGTMKFTARIKRSKGPKLSGLTAGQLNGNQLLTLTVEANKVYYVMVEEGLGFLLMESIPADDAWPALAKLRKTGAK